MAFAARYSYFAHLSGQAQPCMTLRTLEVLVLLAVLQPHPGLRAASSEALTEGHILLVFGIALFHIARKNTENHQNIQDHARKIQHDAADNRRDQRHDQRNNQHRKRELVRAVSASHEFLKAHLNPIPERHFFQLPDLVVTSIIESARHTAAAAIAQTVAEHLGNAAAQTGIAADHRRNVKTAIGAVALVEMGAPLQTAEERAILKVVRIHADGSFKAGARI